MDENFKLGDIVISNYGHDQNNLFIVTNAEIYKLIKAYKNVKE